jgi:hypothetical protein
MHHEASSYACLPSYRPGYLCRQRKADRGRMQRVLRTILSGDDGPSARAQRQVTNRPSRCSPARETRRQTCRWLSAGILWGMPAVVAPQSRPLPSGDVRQTPHSEKYPRPSPSRILPPSRPAQRGRSRGVLHRGRVAGRVLAPSRAVRLSEARRTRRVKVRVRDSAKMLRVGRKILRGAATEPLFSTTQTRGTFPPRSP